ncbi:LysR family transcriptional regulator [Motiliproteus coralliicola]|uniref:LysR family transcriptional regulator n=1 Tax=Motiliproteus coralliicola TaxID=2283196 RepID=A0A369WCM6_9GAMM|nr:LysR substrate-binding domain-containing protein [Motiliproteus coralliicola]RDE19377.1 LysR family transcriptional regulator [Motiliproteus coralliicola]
MKRHIPALRALRAFEATARHLSFQQAAQELNVTHSAISHQIKKLEEELGKPLFDRLGRSIALTDEGQRYFTHIHAALAQIEASTQSIFGEPDQGELTVQVYLGIASRWLVQRLGQFRQQYPRIRIELHSSFSGWDFEPYAADLGVTYCERPETGLSYQKLFKGTLIPVCSPSLFAEGETPTLESLSQKPFLRITESPRNLATWLRAQGLQEEQLEIASEHDNHQLALEAAIAGEGVAIVHSFFACGDLANNNLIIPIDRPVPEIGAWYLVQPKRNLSDSKINLFGNWFRSQLDADPYLQRSL